MFTKFEEVKFKDFIPTFDEMVAVIHEALSGDFPNYLVYPWKRGEVPTTEEIALVYNGRPNAITQFYLPACILLEKELPKKFRDAIERQLDPEGYFKRLDDTERLLKMDFEMFVSTSPTFEQAVNKLIQLSGDYWQENLTPELAEKQIKEMYPDRTWRGQIIT